MVLHLLITITIILLVVRVCVKLTCLVLFIEGSESDRTDLVQERVHKDEGERGTPISNDMVVDLTDGSGAMIDLTSAQDDTVSLQTDSMDPSQSQYTTSHFARIDTDAKTDSGSGAGDSSDTLAGYELVKKCELYYHKNTGYYYEAVSQLHIDVV